MTYFYCALMGYCIGTVNPAYLLGKLQGFDIRTKGSGNAGASNALILFGKALGILCAIFDIAKAFFAIWLGQTLFPEFAHAFPVTAAACVLGHVFPFYMKFRGGKGLACLGGMILYFDWRIFLLMLAAEIAIALITDYICFVPMTASVIFPCIYGWVTQDIIGTLLLLLLAVVIWLKHLENLRRIKAGTEMHLSYLWKPDKEMARMQESLAATEDDLQAHFSKDSQDDK